MDPKVWISLGGLILSILTFVVGRLSATKAQSEAQGEKSGGIASDIGYIKAGIDDLKTEIRAIMAELSDIRTRLAKAEESIAYAHERISELRDK